MPFWLYTPTAESSVTFSWGASAELRGGALGYDLEVNTTETFDPSGVVLTQTGVAAPMFSTAALATGHYFWRVIARAATGSPDDWQAALNDHLTVDAP